MSGGKVTPVQLWASFAVAAALLTAVAVSRSAWFAVLLVPTVYALYRLGVEYRREREAKA